MQCIRMAAERTTLRENEEPVIEIQITTKEEQELINEQVESAAASSQVEKQGPAIAIQEAPITTASNRKMKRANWARQQRQARKTKREVRDQNK